MAAPDFWPSSGYRYLRATTAGQLAITDDFLRDYFRRPEVAPMEESCEREWALHAMLLETPSAAVSKAQLSALADPDAAENYGHVLRFRDHLLAHGTVEAAYMSLFGRGAVSVPPVFIDHLVVVMLRHMLDGTEKPLRLRAAELMFRTQLATQQGEALLLADEAAAVAADGPDLELLNDDNGATYWARSERYDTLLDASFAHSGLDALCRVLEAWVAHLLSVDVRIHPIGSIHSDNWVWHLGLDAEANAILNDLYEQRDVDEERLSRLICLFRLEFRDASLMQERVRGKPVYMALSMTPDKRVRLKPQNLLLNLPLATAA